MRKLIFFVMICIFGIITAQTKINRSFSTTKDQNISLKFDYPQLIKISTWDKDEVQISGTVNINGEENNYAFKITENKEGNSLIIEGKIPDIKNLPRRIKVKNGAENLVFKSREEYQKYVRENNKTFESISDGADINIELEIKVPKSLKAQIESTYGMVEVKNFAGNIDVKAKFGGIDATIAEPKTSKISADTRFGQVYSNLDTKLSGKDSNDFRTLVSATPGTGNQYSLESEFGNIYLRK